jgi:hypothetical protein
MFALVLLLALVVEPQGRGFVIAGETVRFDVDLQPVFTMRQSAASAASIREGMAKWAATGEGRRIIARFLRDDFEVTVTEDSGEPSPGRAPQPGIATLLAANDTTKVKRYALVLNPALAAEYGGRDTVALGDPITPAEVMAAAWAGEMLHIDFYSRGIPLPHHERGDFQERWRAVALELGFPRMRHDTGEVFDGTDLASPRGRRFHP